MNDANFEKLTYSVVFAERRDIGCEWNDVVWDKDHRQIQYHRLYYLTEGKANMKLQGGDIELTPGRIYLIPAYSVLKSNIDGKMNKYYIHFETGEGIFSLYRYISDKYYVESNELTERLFSEVVENYAKSTPSAKMKVQGAMNLLLADFLCDAKASSRDLDKFSGVLKYIDENYKEDIKLDTLAAIMNISTMYFSNYFKRVFRISPKQFILNKRLSESQRLLLETRLSIKEIANLTGFENENYFSEFFSAKVGISALKFRNRELPRTRESIL